MVPNQATRLPAACLQACSLQSRQGRGLGRLPLSGLVPSRSRRDSPASGLGHLFLVVTKPLLNMQDLGGGAGRLCPDPQGDKF